MKSEYRSFERPQRSGRSPNQTEDKMPSGSIADAESSLAGTEGDKAHAPAQPQDRTLQARDPGSGVGQ
jgi:hypothetical protein